MKVSIFLMATLIGLSANSFAQGSGPGNGPGNNGSPTSQLYIGTTESGKECQVLIDEVSPSKLSVRLIPHSGLELATTMKSDGHKKFKTIIEKEDFPSQETVVHTSSLKLVDSRPEQFRINTETTWKKYAWMIQQLSPGASREEVKRYNRDSRRAFLGLPLSVRKHKWSVTCIF